MPGPLIFPVDFQVDGPNTSCLCALYHCYQRAPAKPMIPALWPHIQVIDKRIPPSEFQAVTQRQRRVTDGCLIINDQPDMSVAGILNQSVKGHFRFVSIERNTVLQIVIAHHGQKLRNISHRSFFQDLRHRYLKGRRLQFGGRVRQKVFTLSNQQCACRDATCVLQAVDCRLLKSIARLSSCTPGTLRQRVPRACLLRP